MKPALAAAAGALALALPRLAEACPYCAGASDSSPIRMIVVAAMASSPFIAAVVAVPLIRRLVRRENDEPNE